MKEIRLKDISEKEKYSKVEGRGKGMSGVYVWGYYNSERFIPLYVGKHVNLYMRFIEHYCAFKGGAYSLFEQSELESSTRESKLKRIYKPDSLFTVVYESDKGCDFRKFILENIAFRYMEEPHERNRVLLEQEIADQIGRGRLITRVHRPRTDNYRTQIQEMLSGIL